MTSLRTAAGCRKATNCAQYAANDEPTTTLGGRCRWSITAFRPSARRAASASAGYVTAINRRREPRESNVRTNMAPSPTEPGNSTTLGPLPAVSSQRQVWPSTSSDDQA
jgi:hypothetical protein